LLIHPERISQRPEVFEGTADLHDLPGLEDLVADERMKVHYKVTAPAWTGSVGKWCRV